MTTEADTRTGTLATYGNARTRGVCGMDATDMLTNAVAMRKPIDARHQHHLAPDEVDVYGAHGSGWVTCSSGPTVDRARFLAADRPGIMRPTCWSRAIIFC